MKKYLSFFFVLIFFLGFGQKAIDTLSSKYNEENHQCEKSWKYQDSIYPIYRKEAKLINFKNLYKNIISGIDENKITSQNVIIKIKQIKVYYAYDFVICSRNKNIINPNYNYLHFWTKKSAEEIQKKLRKNIFFDISDSSFDPNEQGKKTVKNSFYRYILELNQYRKSYFYDPKNIVFSPIKFDDANVLLLEFKNKLNKIVIVKFNYNNEDILIYKTYQYQNKKWVEISTKEEYKF